MHSFVVGADTFDVMQAQGPDVVRFLQGQLTCDVAALASNSQTYGACCNNKGRVMAAFTLVRVADVYYLCMPHGLGEILLSALQKYLPFYKCELTMASSGHQLIALAAVDAGGIDHGEKGGGRESGQAWSADWGWQCKLEGQPSRALWWSNQTPGEIMVALHTPASGTLEQWETLGLLNGHYPFRPSDTGLYTPQDLHFDQNGYVSFSKGCYTGQEIVARMHYRGKPKKHLFLAELAHSVSPAEAGQQLRVSDSQDQTQGNCRLIRNCEGLNLALIELPADFSGNFGALRIADSPVLAGCAFDPKVIQFSHFI